MHKSVLLDTSFIFRFLKDTDELFKNADDYFSYFIRKKITMKLSIISIAEYMVKGSYDQLPFSNVQMLPFNANHAINAGEYAKIIYDIKKKGEFQEVPRKIVLPDMMLFAQANQEPSIEYYITADTRSHRMYNTIKEKVGIKFQFIDLHDSCAKTFGEFDFEQVVK